jgi:ATPases of the AAA+ class
MSLLLSETTYGLSEYAERRFQLGYLESSASLSETSIAVMCENIADLIPLFDFPSYRSGRKLIIENPDQSVLVMAEASDRIAEIEIMGERGAVDRAASVITSHFDPVPVRVKWVYTANGDSVKLPIRTDNLPRSEFYPQLGEETLASYYDRFMASRSNVLVLIGPPGTGKTSFIRGLLHHTGGGAMVSYDTAILESDEIFADFMSGDEAFMILEDADTFLSSRSKGGNTIMHRFLNLGDGLMSTSGKKIVFSTNLPSVRDIDDALLRPGRCFDVMRFGRLEPDRARAVKPDYAGTQPVSLAELLGEGGVVTKPTVGFL